VALLSDTAGAQTIETAKLDESLRESVERGCHGRQEVIITVEPGYREALQLALTAHGDRVTGEFPAINAIAADIHCDDLVALARFGSIRAVSTNAAVGVTAANDTKSTAKQTENAARELARETEGLAAKALKKNAFATLGATKLRDVKPSGVMLVPGDSTLTNSLTGAFQTNLKHSTYTGSGIGVAVIDSGIQPGIDFGDRITAFYDLSKGDIRTASPSDEYGHGTHVAGLIGSEYVGVAPYARLIGLKVLDGKGQGTTDNVVRAIEFAITNRHLLGINVLNLSLGHPIYEPAATDPLVQAVEHATRVGLTVVVAAGNFGTSPKTGQVGYAGIVSPANAPSAISAGAVNTFDTVTRDDDRVAPYSSRGPSWYDGFAKPDVVAPGHDLLSVAAEGSTLKKLQEARGNKGSYMKLSGTSMAAGVTSGIVALVLQANHKLTPNALKAVLEFTAIPVFQNDGKRFDALTQGAGQIQTEGAVTLAKAINTSAPMGAGWLTSKVTPSTAIGHQVYPWSRSIIWGQRRVAGAKLLSEQRPAWATNIVWGEGWATRTTTSSGGTLRR
jgi:serine protease AprX